MIQRDKGVEQIDTSSRPQAATTNRYTDMPDKHKRKLPLYIPKIMADLIWATTKDRRSVNFGFGYKCHLHGRLFDLEHIRTCSLLTGCPDIARYAKMIKEGGKIRLWD